MHRFTCRRLTLNHLVLLLAIASAGITLANSFYASYQVQKQQLIAYALERNQAYATKMASTTNDFLQASQQQLAYAAGIIQRGIQQQSFLLAEANRLRLQTDGFNTVVIVNHTGKILATSPDTLALLGQTLENPEVRRNLARQTAAISRPYLSATGNLMVFVSHPLFDPKGRYLGYVGGSLYLKKASFLNTLLGKHYYQDGSYLYVVDQNKRLIYHPNLQRVGEVIDNNRAIDQVLSGETGAGEITNSKQIRMLAGYAPVPAAGWGVVTQRPLQDTLAPMDELMEQVLYRSLPLGLATFICIWLFSRFIARPLQQLAESARTLDTPGIRSQLVDVNSWYVESSDLKQALLKGVGLMQAQIGQLRHAASTDPLTGAYNRRALDLLMLQMEEKNVPFALLALDIDHFKQVNDRFGHSAGDKALVSLTRTLTQLCRDDDIVARIGGEEFVIILPRTSKEQALLSAERIRQAVASQQIEPVGHIEISVGIASLSQATDNYKQVLKRADQALYQAKREGRNRCVLYQSVGTVPESHNPPR